MRVWQGARPALTESGSTWRVTVGQKVAVGGAVSAMVAVGVNVGVAVQAGVAVAVAVDSSVGVAEGEDASVFVGGKVGDTAVSCSKATGSAVTALLKLSNTSLL